MKYRAVVFTEGLREAWIGRTLGTLGRPKVVGELSEALQDLAVLKPRALILEMPVTGIDETAVLELILAHESTPTVTVFITPAPDLALSGIANLRVLAAPASDAALLEALGERDRACWSLSETKEALAGVAERGSAMRTVALIARLTVLADTEFVWEEAWPTLRFLAPRVRTVARHIPRQVPDIRPSDKDAPRPVVLRLIDLWSRIMGAALRALDATPLATSVKTGGRCWLVLQKVRILSYAVEIHVRFGFGCDRATTWTKLHDLTRYVHRRCLPEQKLHGTSDTARMLWETRQHYVRALLWDALSDRPPRDLVRERVAERIGRWARRTAMRESRITDWRKGRWIIDAAGHRGARFVEAQQHLGMTYFILEPPRDCIELLDARRRGPDHSWGGGRG